MKFIAFDLETTGTKPQADRIVEIGAVLFDGDQAAGTYGTLIDPGVPIPADASAVNGITDEMVRGKPRIADVLSDFADFCGFKARPTRLSERSRSIELPGRRCAARGGEVHRPALALSASKTASILSDIR